MQVAYIGMGGNIPSAAGPPEATLAAAVERLGSLGRIVAASSLYSTEPVGFADQPRFVNAVIAIETRLGARQVLESLLCIERAFGRDRSAGIQNGPRTLDLDLLLLGDEVVHEAGLDLPHPRLAERAFVLVPLNEIAPELVIGTLGKTVKELLQGLTSDKTRDAVLPLQRDDRRAGSCDDDGMRASEPDAHGDG
jgi:2-amino-4-hydroxy-6-hydroxymethyldihydropteridine diphosphokinase